MAIIHSKLPKGKNALVAEVLHSKVPGIRNTVYIFDAVALGGKVLEGTTFVERYRMLKDIFGQGETRDTHVDNGNSIWFARSFKAGFRELYDRIIKAPENEGIVVKDPEGKLSCMLRQGMDTRWQAKCRRPAANYAF